MRDRQSWRSVAGSASAAAFSLVLGSCVENQQQKAPPAVSLEQAKTITAKFEQQGFAPPPRTIADIAAILDTEKPDATKIAAFAATADSQPPGGAKGEELAKFYRDRGIAEEVLGRLRQAVEDHRRAESILEAKVREPSTRPDDRAMDTFFAYIIELGVAETTLDGDLREENQTWNKVLTVPNGRPNWPLVLSLGEARNGTELGDVEGTRKIVAASEEIYAKEKSRFESQYWFPTQTAFNSGAQGALDLVEGKFADAETDIRRAIAAWDKWLADPKSNFNGQSSRETDLNIEHALHRDLGLAFLHQGRTIEAELETRNALFEELQVRGRYAAQSAEMMVSLAVVLSAEGRDEDAAQLDPYGAGWLVKVKPGDWAAAKAMLTPGAAVAAPYEAKMAADGFAGCAA